MIQYIKNTYMLTRVWWCFSWSSLTDLLLNEEQTTNLNLIDDTVQILWDVEVIDLKQERITNNSLSAYSVKLLNLTILR